MDFKWLKSAYQFEAEPGGGGGDSAPAPTGTTPTPAADPVTLPDDPRPAGDVNPPPGPWSELLSASQ